jgi:hypothetical protein
VSAQPPARTAKARTYRVKLKSLCKILKKCEKAFIFTKILAKSNKFHVEIKRLRKSHMFSATIRHSVYFHKIFEKLYKFHEESKRFKEISFVFREHFAIFQR